MSHRQKRKPSDSAVKIARVTGVKVKLQKNKKVKISFKAVKKADGYEIYRSAKKNKGYKKICTLGKRKKSYTDKKAKKTSYYKVRAYRRIRGSKKYGKYSLPVKCKGVFS